MYGLVSVLGSLAILGYVSTQGYFEERRHTAHTPTLDTIPKEFEITDVNPAREFEKHANHIHHLAKRDNITVVYKVKVEALKKQKTKSYKKKYVKKVKAKKYNIPLKKNSMKLSNFEVLLRKTAEENNHYPQRSSLIQHRQSSTDEPLLTTKILHMKYKPVLSNIKNFTKIIRPVKNRIITLS